MFKNIFNDLKLNRITYLLEVIETQNFKEKVDAFNKLRKIKIDEEIGHLIIDKVMSLKKEQTDNFNVDISLLSLLFNNYYDSYSKHLFQTFKKLNKNSKYELLNILANSNDPSQLILYRTLIFNYYKDLDSYPLGTIFTDKDNYELLFPELYETFKNINNKNSILILLNDFINLGVVPLFHLNKYSKYLQKQIISLFKEGIKFKLDPKENFMSNKDYVDLRIYLEAAINIEYYVSKKETRTYLDKLYKTKDNQLKLFILENYGRKGKDISKININSIAKDSLSRYPLYSFLAYNDLQKLMPKKYRNNKDLSLSDLFINFCILTGYSKIPYDFELLEEKIINENKYYIYKFKTSFNYNEEITDPVTDYLVKNIKIDKELIEKGESTYIGISGGFNKDENPSLIENNLEGIKIARFNDDYEKIVDKLLGNIKKEEPVAIDEKEEIPDEKKSKLANILSFSRILTFACLSIIILFTVLILYVSNVDLFNLKKNSQLRNANTIHAVLLKQNDLFSEINYRDIFNREENEYYVLFFKKKDKSTYYEYLNTLLKNEYKFYFVDLSKEENKPIFEGNETGFVIHGDTLLKVNNHEYSFYIVDKANIISELKSYVDEIIKKQEEERIKKEKEEAKKKKAEEKENTKKSKKNE